MTAPLKKVAVKKPGKSLINAKPDEWHYGSSFNPKKIEDIHASFVQLLRDSGAEVFWMPENVGLI